MTANFHQIINEIQKVENASQMISNAFSTYIEQFEKDVHRAFKKYVANLV
jgi:hypothetical protein